MYSICEEKWINYRVLVGVIFLNLSGGFSIFFGNLYAYAESYYRFRLDRESPDLSPSWVLSICLTVLPIGSLVADAMRFKFGLRQSVLLGVILYGSGFLCTYFSVMNSVWATSLSFGVFGMFGLGLVEVLSYYFTSAWFPHRQGLAGAVLASSSSVGAIIYNIIITSYINPKNLKPDYIKGDIAYFTQSEILDRVPMLFIILGTMTLVTQLIGVLMVKNPDFGLTETEMIIKKPSEEEVMKLKLSYHSSSKSSLSSTSNETLNSDKESDAKIVINIDRKNEKSSNKPSTKRPPHVCDKSNDKCPKDVLKSTTLYLLWSSLMSLSLAMLIVSNYYKFFAQVWIPDDSFLTAVGSSSAISCTLMRLVMGVLIDRYRIKTVVIGTLSTTCICLTFWYFTAIFNRWTYFLNTNLLTGVTGTVFLLYPLASMKFFGLTYFATNTGLIMMAMTVVDVAAAPIITLLRVSYGWFWLFFSVSSFIAASLVATTVLMTRSQIFGTK